MLEVGVQRLRPAFGAVARILDAAEGHLGARRRGLVDPQHADLELVGEQVAFFSERVKA
jgi:hypothetical protein